MNPDKPNELLMSSVEDAFKEAEESERKWKKFEAEELERRWNEWKFENDLLSDVILLNKEYLEKLTSYSDSLLRSNISAKYQRAEEVANEAMLKLQGSSLFSVDDFKEPDKLIGELRDAINLVSLHLKSFLSETFQKKINTDNKGKSLSKDFLDSLVREFNCLLEKSFYQQEIFGQAKLSEETNNLLSITNKSLSITRKQDLLRLNRYLLEDTYPQEIAKSFKIKGRGCVLAWLRKTAWRMVQNINRTEGKHNEKRKVLPNLAMSKKQSNFDDYLSKLDDREKLIICLHIQDSCTFKEIAELLGVPDHTSKISNSYYNALEKIKKQISD